MNHFFVLYGAAQITIVIMCWWMVILLYRLFRRYYTTHTITAASLAPLAVWFFTESLVHIFQFVSLFGDVGLYSLLTAVVHALSSVGAVLVFRVTVNHILSQPLATEYMLVQRSMARTIHDQEKTIREKDETIRVLEGKDI